MRRACKIAIRYGVMFLVLFGASLQSLAADVMTSVHQVLSNPSAFHRHDVVLKGRLTLIGQWEGKDTLGRPICGPMFKLDDDTGEIPVLYIIRCDQQEVSRISAMAGGKALIHATIDSDTVTMNPDGSDYRLRAMATKIQRQDK
ncbi:MAG: hypothetical protein E8D41_11525 [Nitrospira sp.]|nr:MAG: hypothetical protein E8D41_11525 [Nitrospira sp.]